MEAVDVLNHLDGIKGNLYLSEKEYLSPAVLHDRGEPAAQIIYSNMSEIVQHQQYIFETLWYKSRPATDKILEIENGIELEFLEIISDPEKATDIYTELINSIQSEARFLLADSKSILRADKLGVIQNLVEVSTRRGAVVKIVCPFSQENSEIIKNIVNAAPLITVINGGSSHTLAF